MNVPFVTGNAELDAAVIAGASQHGLLNLKGHRSVGGMRASLYNAMPLTGVQALVDYLAAFEAQHH
jgi:phosphoserine aminotransferase